MRHLVRRGVLAALASAVLIAGCDRGPAELVRDIDAAREGCTEEMLKAADEECVRMFERYADMAAGAMETYIGGMRAFDEAIRRRSGVLFDTAGLGNALGDGWRRAMGTGSTDPAAARARVPSRDPWQGDYDAMPQPYYSADPSSSVAGGRWSDPVPEGALYGEPYLQGDPDAGPAPATPGSVPTGGRGVLLPPEERLRRPWIDGADADDRYVEDPRLRQPGTAGGAQGGDWDPYPNPYPNGSQGGYPYGPPGQYPYGPQGAVPYPYGGTGPAYPYPQQPGPGPYPYPDDGSGRW